MDYRPALRQRSGAGEYTHQLARALLAVCGPERPALTLFSSSWKDRLHLGAELSGATGIDRRVPVAVLNLAWHRLGWPTAEALTGAVFDVAHSSHPLLLPTRRAAQVVTIHDLDFLAHPERTRREIRRDYPALARRHAQAADCVLVPSHFTAAEVERQLGVPAGRIVIGAPGAPDWAPRAAPPRAREGYVLFLGTLEPRKNLSALLDAYEQLLGRRREVPPLVVGGQSTREAAPWVDRMRRAPLNRAVRYVGYVEAAARPALYAGAVALVHPALEEGFGLTLLEAMTIGVPVVAANRGSLPEVLDGAGTLVDPYDADALAAAIERVGDNPAYTAALAARGVARARAFRWRSTADCVLAAYRQAIAHKRCASA